MVNKTVHNAVLGCNLKNDRMISVHFQGKPFNITVIPVDAPSTNAEKLKLNGSVKTYQIRSDQSLSCVRLFVTPGIAARQASLSITSFQSLLKLMSITSVMPSNHLILCCPHLLLPSIFPSIRVLQTFKQTEIILSFFRLHPRTAFWTVLLTMMATPFLLRDSCPQ